MQACQQLQGVDVPLQPGTAAGQQQQRGRYFRQPGVVLCQRQPGAFVVAADTGELCRIHAARNHLQALRGHHARFPVCSLWHCGNCRPRKQGKQREGAAVHKMFGKQMLFCTQTGLIQLCFGGH